MSVEELHKNGMMDHLLTSLDEGKDIGHYGRLVFAMVSRYFLSKDEVVAYLAKDPDFSKEDALALYGQVISRGYSPPRRERVLEWQKEQNFPICPNPDDPDACNVYSDLQFPDEVYGSITDYYEKKAES